GNEVERQDEIPDESEEQQLAAPRHPLVVQQPRHDHDAVGDERRERASLLAATNEKQPADERQPHRRYDRQAQDEPHPPDHHAQSCNRGSPGSSEKIIESTLLPRITFVERRVPSY